MNKYEDLEIIDPDWDLFSLDNQFTPSQLDRFTDMILRADVKAGNKLKGDNPILFIEHLKTRYKREIYNQNGIPDPSIEQGVYFRCVDDQTQALSKKGWKFYFELSTDDEIWSYDMESDRYSWKKVLDLFVNEYVGPLNVLESQNISARTTPGHSWVIKKEWKDYFEKVTKIEPRDYIPLVRPSVYETAIQEEPLYELLGWVLSDGCYFSTNKMQVTQAVHNKKIPHLLECLEKNNIPTTPFHVDNNNVGKWYIKAEIGKQLKQIAPIKKVASVDLPSLTFSQLYYLHKGIHLGDGYTRNNGVGAEIATTYEKEADAIQMLCTLLGKTTRLHHVVRKSPNIIPEFWNIYHKTRSVYAYARPAIQDDEHYEGKIWCPSVETGFWLARRNGKVYTTGNTHPQGRKTNSIEARKTGGASFYR